MSEDPLRDDRTKNANRLIRNYMAWSMGMGLIPVPIVDFFAVGALQLDMIRHLCKLYDVDFRENDGKAIISALTGSGLARLGAQAIKIIPGVGSVIGGFSMSILSGASTYAVGEIFKKHFETGGTILDFDSESLKKKYNDLFEKGKKVAAEYKNEQEDRHQGTPHDSSSHHQKESAEGDDDKLFLRLNELSEMKQKGVITDTEYETLKKKLIERYTGN